MTISCKICRRETELDPKQKNYDYRELCPECRFLVKQQNQPPGPEKMILRILHEHLVKCGVVDPKKFRVWRTMPDFRDKNAPAFWTESIFGNFLKRRYAVDYLMKDSIGTAAKFGAALRDAFDESKGGTALFEFDSKHLAFSVSDFIEVERDEKIPPGVVQYCGLITF